MTFRPRFLGKFELVRRIGVGGTAEVYEAVLHGAEGFNKRVALKALLPDSREDPAIVDMFIDEATIAARLHHPNIIDVYEFGQIEDTHYLTMELIDGWTLRRAQRLLLASGMEFPLPLAAHCVREICKALEYIHSAAQRIVHRDVSPQNVFISRQGLIKLGDFGIAKTHARRSRTESGQLKGKLAYLAPEQVTGEAVSPRTDVYAAGLILFELLTGTPYIRGEREVDVFRTAMNPPLTPPSSLRPDAAPLDSVVLHALKKHPTLRYASARVMADDLERYLSGTGDVALAEIVSLLERRGTGDRPRPLPPPSLRRPAPLSARQPDHRTTKPLPVMDQQTPPLEDRRQVEIGAKPGAPRKRWLFPTMLLALIVCGALAVLLWPGATPRRSTPRSVVPVPPDSTAASAPADSRANLADHRLPSIKPMKRAWARHRRSRHRPRTFARRIDPAPVPVAAEPKSKPEPDRFARPREQLNALVAAARSKGLYAGDDAGFDRLLGQARGDRTAGALNRLDQFVRAFNADRRFAEAKLARLNRAIKKADLPADQRQQMGRLSQQILRAIIEGRYVQASKTMQFALKRLKSHGQ